MLLIQQQPFFINLPNYWYWTYLLFTNENVVKNAMTVYIATILIFALAGSFSTIWHLQYKINTCSGFARISTIILIIIYVILQLMSLIEDIDILDLLLCLGQTTGVMNLKFFQNHVFPYIVPFIIKSMGIFLLFKKPI